MTPKERAARERKQKIFVIVGGLVLLGLVALQLPKLLGGSSESAAPATTPATSTTSTPGQPAPTFSTSTPVAAVGAARPGVAVPGKLVAFGSFQRKNPFVQQVLASDGSTDGAPATGEKAKSGEGSKEFSLGTRAATPAVTIVAINGVRQTLEPGTAFPASDPVFALVAEKPDAKAVVIGVVGGAYKSGSRTTRLELGKPLVLVNTTTGARYRLVLVAVGAGDDAEKPASSK